MTSNSGADGVERAAARPDRRDRVSIERTFVQCFHNAIVIPSPLMLKELKEATRRLAEALRDDGAQPEQALMRLKALIRDPCDGHWTPSLYGPEGPIREESQVYRRLFEWWLTAHFEKPLSPPQSVTLQRVTGVRHEPSASLASWSGQATADAR